MNSSSTSVTKVIRGLIADDHPVFREGLVTILKSENDIKVVAETTDDEEASELYDQLSPDVLCSIFGCRKKMAASCRSMILFGLYSGQRLGDVPTLRWNNIDLVRDELRLSTRKTGKCPSRSRMCGDGR